MSAILSEFMSPMPMLLCMMASSCASMSVFKDTVCGSMGSARGECSKFAGFSMPIASSLACVAMMFVFMSISGGHGGGGMYR